MWNACDIYGTEFLRESYQKIGMFELDISAFIHFNPAVNVRR